MMFDRIQDGLWWDKAWSLVSGCTPVSPACANCWAARQTHMRGNNPNGKVRARNEGLTADGHFNGKIRLNHEFLDKPLRTRKPTAWAVWNDLLHEDVDEKYIAQAFAVMGLCPQHVFMILTKRPARMKALLADEDFLFHIGWFRAQAERTFNITPENGWEGWPYKNIWLGVTAENQQTADERIPILLQIPAAMRFVSVEPMLGPIDFNHLQRNREVEIDAMNGTHGVARPHGGENERIDWVICGGESGPNARLMHPDWARSLRDQCQAAGTPFFFKQWGEYVCPRQMPAELYRDIEDFGPGVGPETIAKRVGKKKAGRLLDGLEWLYLPEVE